MLHAFLLYYDDYCIHKPKYSTKLEFTLNVNFNKSWVNIGGTVYLQYICSKY